MDWEVLQKTFGPLIGHIMSPMSDENPVAHNNNNNNTNICKAHNVSIRAESEALLRYYGICLLPVFVC